MLNENDPALPEDTKAIDPQVEEGEAESAEQSEEGSETSEDQGKTEDKPNEPEEIEIVINGEPAKVDEPAPKDERAWSKAREEARQLKAKVAQLEREAQARTQPAAAPDPGPPPTREDPDVQWDDEKLLAKHAAWLKAKDAQEAEKAQASQKAEKQRANWEDNRTKIVKARESLIARMPSSPEKPGYLDSEAIVDSALASDRIGKMAAIMHICREKTPLIVAALGRDPARLKDLADEEDMARFIAKVSKLEDKVQEKKKGTTPPPPEGKPKGTGSGSGAADATERRLIDEAAASGNVNALRAHQKAKRAK